PEPTQGLDGAARPDPRSDPARAPRPPAPPAPGDRNPTVHRNPLLRQPLRDWARPPAGGGWGSLNRAEREGFEPSVRFNPYTAFPVPHLRPLGHLSEII